MTVLTGQALGGVLYVLLGPPILFLLNGASFLFAAATERLIRPPASRGLRAAWSPAARWPT
jgi:hypothetical protein